MIDRYLQLIYSLVLGIFLLDVGKTEAVRDQAIDYLTASSIATPASTGLTQSRHIGYFVGAIPPWLPLYLEPSRKSYSNGNQQSDAELADNSCSSALNEEQALNIPLLSQNPQELDETCPTHVVTKDTICQTGLTIPSLWWADEQFGDKLLENWLAYPDEKRIDLVVNRQIWGLMDYYQRYAFVHRMGSVVRETGETGDTGYNLRVFNRQEPELCLASYTCSANNCQLKITGFGL